MFQLMRLSSFSCTSVVLVNFFLISESLPVRLPNAISDNNSSCSLEIAEAVKQQLHVIASAQLRGFSLTQNPECGPGLWVELANWNMQNQSHQCPDPWTEIQWTGRTCTTTDCFNSLRFDIFPLRYSHVCGRVTGQATGSVDAFKTFHGNGTLDGIYMDGVTIMRGSPRKHVWSFGAGHGGTFRCPCDSQDRTFALLPPPFVANNYFCDGSYNQALWDGLNCNTACCNFNSPPWFRVSLGTATSDDIEVRLCVDQMSNNERVFIQNMQLYIQ